MPGLSTDSLDRQKQLLSRFGFPEWEPAHNFYASF